MVNFIQLLLATLKIRMPVRINKYLSEAGFCSRREADRLIQKGLVKINDELALIGSKVTESDNVVVDGKQINKDVELVYLAFNKPLGVVSTTNKEIKDNIVDYINYPKRIFHIGRLDKDSEGLILMTNDGNIVNKILRSENNHEKEYHVEVTRNLGDDFCHTMANGIQILDTITKPCFVTQTGVKSFKIVLTEGLNRQIRRMCDQLGYQISSLKRLRIMNIKLDIPVGQYRDLTTRELRKLNELLVD